VAGCAARRSVIYTPEQVREQFTDRASKPAAELEIPYEISEELEQLARERVDSRRPGQTPLQAIVETVFDVEHDYGITGSGDEVFAAGRGDCISATSLFIGLSRAVGLKTYFIEALGVEGITAEEDLNVYHRHVLAAHGPTASATVVDFSRVSTDYIHFQVLSDLEAVAHYHNTQGYQALRREDPGAALERFDTAVALAPGLAWVHNNRGVALRRLGRLEEAEASLRHAIELDADYPPAHANLALVLRMTDRLPEARKHLDYARELRAEDPLRRYRQAREAFEDGRIEEAIDELEAAVRETPRFLAAWRELGRLYLEIGHRARARRSVRRALEIDPRDHGSLLLDAVLHGSIAYERLAPTWPIVKVERPSTSPSATRRSPNS
jgi:Flp pilus assembly protein TadD